MTLYRVHCPTIPRGEQVHGGVRALHRLVDELRHRGRDARLVDINPTRAATGIDIWPEIRPATGHHAVEWLLGPRIFPTSGAATYQWEPWYEPGVRVLQVPITDLAVFHPPNPGTRRKGTAVYRGKGPRIDTPPSVTEITRDWPAKRQELADLLRSVEVLVTTDGMTALALEATLCGCPVLFLGPAGKERTHHAFNIAGGHGYAYRADELAQAASAARAAFAHYIDVSLPKMHTSIDRFVEATS